MDAELIFNLGLVLVSPLFACFPYSKKYVRARWTKPIFFTLAVLGPVDGMLQIALDRRWIEFGVDIMNGLNGTLACGRGFALGVIFVLFLSGDLLGRKPTLPGETPRPKTSRATNESERPPARRSRTDQPSRADPVRQHPRA